MYSSMFLQQILQKVVPLDLTFIFSPHIANNFHVWSWPWFYTFYVCPVYSLFTGKRVLAAHYMLVCTHLRVDIFLGFNACVLF